MRTLTWKMRVEMDEVGELAAIYEATREELKKEIDEHMPLVIGVMEMLVSKYRSMQELEDKLEKLSEKMRGRDGS